MVMLRGLIAGAVALALGAALATASPDTPERVSDADTSQAYEVSAEEARAIYDQLAVWCDARAEGWRRLIDVMTLPDRLAEGVDAASDDAFAAAWGQEFDRTITETSFYLDRGPHLPRLFLFGEEGERLRDALYVIGDSQQRALDRIATLGSGMRNDARAVTEAQDSGARARISEAAQSSAALREAMAALADDLSHIALAARTDPADSAAIHAIAARVSERDRALRALTARART